MRQRLCLQLVFGCLLAVVAVPAVEWRSALRVDFEGEAPLRDTDRFRVQQGEAAVLAGRLHLQGASCALMLNAALPRDVSLSLELAPHPAQPPGILGVMLQATSGHHASFSIGPQGCAIRATGLEATVEQPRLPLEPERAFRLEARREGRRLTLAVDGAVVLDASVDRVVGAAGFSRLVLFAEHGMVADNVLVDSRVPAHPDCCPPDLPWLPLTRTGRTVVATEGVRAAGLDEALAALNAGRHEEAKARFAALDDPLLRLVGEAYVLGDLDYFERPAYGDHDTSVDFGEFGDFAERWRAERTRRPDLALLAVYWPLIEHAGRLTLSRRHRGDAEFVAGWDQRVNPFAEKAELYVARCIYWDGMEGGNASRKSEALGRMKGLRRHWPDNRVLREYLGPPVPWGEELNAATETHPVWAAYLREAYARELAILERYVDVRQATDGQFGGGWGDDVEMLRKWVPIAAISTCAGKIRGGIDRLVEGIWTYRCLDGFDREVADVEHSAEPTADSFPTQLLLRYGDPRYVAFNLRAAKTVQERFMALDDNGYPRFLSAHFGAEGVARHDRSGFDTHYHTRAMKHHAWLAWYGNREARDWYLRWVDGWRRVAMIDAPDKPAGLVTGTLFFPSGSYQPPSGVPWWAEPYQHTYGPWGIPSMMHKAFLQAYALSGDREFLRPFQHLMDGATHGPLERGQPDDGTPERFRQAMAHTPGTDLTALYRFLTDETVYDEYTRRFGTAVERFQIDRSLDRYLASFEKAAKSLRTNLWYWTTETMSTDRLHLPAVEDVWGAYSGALTLTGDNDPPTMGVTYDTPSADFAALVVENRPQRLRVWLYGFWDAPTPVGLFLWRLEPGEYILTAGQQLPGEHAGQYRYAWEPRRRVRLLHCAERVDVVLPPQQVYVVDLRLDQPVEVPAAACDLALAERDIRAADDGVSVTVYNIGPEAAEPFAVALQRKKDAEWETVSVRQCAPLAAPAAYVPATCAMVFDLAGSARRGEFRVVADPDDALFEICEINNQVMVAAP